MDNYNRTRYDCEPGWSFLFLQTQMAKQYAFDEFCCLAGWGIVDVPDPTYVVV